VVPAHSEQFVSISDHKDFPLPLTALKNSQCMEIKYHEPLKECKLSITDKMAEMWRLLQGIRVNLSFGINTEQVKSLPQE